jgi:hypothetical protein
MARPGKRKRDDRRVSSFRVFLTFFLSFFRRRGLDALFVVDRITTSEIEMAKDGAVGYERQQCARADTD